MKRTAQFIEEQKSVKLPKKRGPKPGSKPHPNSAKNLKEPWPKGVSANPGGLPGTDLAAVAARRFFERHPEIEDFEIPKDFNAYAYSVLADRGYGKVKEVKKVEHSGELAITVKMVKAKDAD
jgi:hypothetical protein